MEINVNLHKWSRLPKQLAILGYSFSASKNLATQIFDTFSILFPSHVTSTANAFYSVLLATFFFGAIFDANFFSLLMAFFFFLMVFIGKGKSCNKNKTRQLLVIDQCAMKIANCLLTVFLVALFTPVNSFFLAVLGFFARCVRFRLGVRFLAFKRLFPFAARRCWWCNIWLLLHLGYVSFHTNFTVQNKRPIQLQCQSNRVTVFEANICNTFASFVTL